MECRSDIRKKESREEQLSSLIENVVIKSQSSLCLDKYCQRSCLRVAVSKFVTPPQVVVVFSYVNKGVRLRFTLSHKTLNTGYAVLSRYQYFKGYTFFISRYHKEELHLFVPEIRYGFLREMAMVSEAVYKASSRRSCYELLGNTEPHLHWHLIQRFGTDPDPMN